LAAAAQAVDAARAALDRAVKPGSALDVAGAKAQLDAAVAQRDVFSSESANAPVALAQAQLQSAQAALELLTIRSPITGTVAKINVSAGEWAAPGQPVIVVSDLERLRVETKDLSERDVAKVAIGQKVTVLVKAMAQEVSGRVKSVAPLAETIGGDVVYRAVIELDSRPAGLRPGMSVDVRFN
ncbi:MAG: HlyD family efflux transporter periplasmic adaptor subunit, partial [Anaerolineae bacterium]